MSNLEATGPAGVGLLWVAALCFGVSALLLWVQRRQSGGEEAPLFAMLAAANKEHDTRFPASAEDLKRAMRLGEFGSATCLLFDQDRGKIAIVGPGSLCVVDWSHFTHYTHDGMAITFYAVDIERPIVRVYPGRREADGWRKRLKVFFPEAA